MDKQNDKKMEYLTDKYWVTPYNFLEEVRKDFTLPEKVNIHDVTLREAEQAPGVVFSPEEKIDLAKALDRLGVYSIEIFPAVSQEDQQVVKKLVKMNLKTKVVCLTRCIKNDIDVVGECGGKHVIIEGNANPWSCKATWGISEDKIIKDFVDTIKYANKNNINVSAMPWDDFRAPLPFLERLYKSIVYDGGASRVVISDTSGNSLPWTTVYIIRKLREWLPKIPIEMHAHNEFGLATIDMISAIIGGASFVHTCMNGLGNRAGNAATEEVAMILELLLGVPTGIDLSKIYPTSKLVEKLTKIPIPKNKAIIGDNLFTYEAGLSIFMFQKMKEHGRPTAYVPFVPELIGRDKYNFVLGKQSGRTSVRLKLKEIGVTVSEEELKEIVDRVKKEAIARKDIITIPILKKIVAEVKASINKLIKPDK